MHPEADDEVAKAIQTLASNTALDAKSKEDVLALVEQEAAKLADTIARAQRQLNLYLALADGLRGTVS